MSAIIPRTQFSPDKHAFSSVGPMHASRRNKTPSINKKDQESTEHCLRQSIQELNLQGISRICNENYPWFRRAFWGCLWLTFCVSCIYHFIMCLNRFLYNPTTVDVDYIVNATIVMPCVTICPADNLYRSPAIWTPFVVQNGGNLSYKNAYDLMTRTNITVDHLWNISRMMMPNEIFGIGEMNTGSVLNGYDFSNYDLERKETLTIAGVCITYKPRRKIQCVGVQSGIGIKDTSNWDESNSTLPKMYSVVYHSDAEMHLLHYYGPLLIGSSLGYGQSSLAAIRIQEITNLNLWNNPCESEERVRLCQLRCFERILLNAVHNAEPCRLPFMTDAIGLTPCKTPHEFLAMFSATESAIRGFRSDNCRCPRSCNRRIYREDFYNKNNINEMFALYVVIPRCLVEKFEEKMRYDFPAFFSDVGGALGLLLGLSIINVAEILEALFLNVCLPRMKRQTS